MSSPANVPTHRTGAANRLEIEALTWTSTLVSFSLTTIVPMAHATYSAALPRHFERILKVLPLTLPTEHFLGCSAPPHLGSVHQWYRRSSIIAATSSVSSEVLITKSFGENKSGLLNNANTKRLHCSGNCVLLIKLSILHARIEYNREKQLFILLHSAICCLVLARIRECRLLGLGVFGKVLFWVMWLRIVVVSCFRWFCLRALGLPWFGCRLRLGL